MPTTKVTNNVLASNAALNNLNAGASIAFTKSVSVTGNFTVDTNTFFVDSTNNRVGIGTTSPTAGYSLDVAGAIRSTGNLLLQGNIVYLNSQQALTQGANILTLGASTYFTSLSYGNASTTQHTFNGSGITAATASFTSTTRPTSAGTGSPAATSLITLTDADTRFGGPIYTSFLDNNTSYTNDATGTTILSVTLPAGTYQIEAFARFTANASNSKTTPAITGGASELWTGFRETYNNGGSPSRIAGSNTPSVGGGPWGATSNSDNHGRYGTLKVSATATYSIIASQNTTSATTTTVSAGAYIIARKIV